METIVAHICGVLSCGAEEIEDLRPLDQGLTNSSYLFTCRGIPYVYREPGRGTDAIINRQAEAYSQGIARQLGLDDTFVYEDPEVGWKISRYLEGCDEFDYENPDHVSRALAMLRGLHTCGEKSAWSFDYQEETVKIIGLLKESGYPIPVGFEELLQLVELLWDRVAAEDSEPVLCHNDFYGPNILVHGDQMALIDWEYSAMGDYAGDLGSFFSQGSGYTPERACSVLPYYFGDEPEQGQLCHCMAYTAIVGFYWYVWAMYKDSQGNHPGEWMRIWRDAARDFGVFAKELYDKTDKETD